MIDEKTTADGSALMGLLGELRQRVDALETRLDTEVADIREQLPADRAAIVLFSGDLDKVLAAFIIATGAATMGLETTIFFTFWGLTVLKRKRVLEGKNLMERMMAVMTPETSKGLDPSKMAYFGAGAVMLRQMMKAKDVASLEEMVELSRECGVRFVACEMSMDVMGVRQDELRSDADLGGVATFLGEAVNAKLSLFI
ncbi:MAG: DsrE/DsrF/DrsH-like family protein [Candidatus Sericytochromatia bacterium]|nr:DsrE/DsrF/DrsH-like family protein [Candidatus Sericytochromatia bacterium]